MTIGHRHGSISATVACCDRSMALTQGREIASTNAIAVVIFAIIASWVSSPRTEATHPRTGREISLLRDRKSCGPFLISVSGNNHLAISLCWKALRTCPFTKSSFFLESGASTQAHLRTMCTNHRLLMRSQGSHDGTTIPCIPHAVSL